MIAAILAMLVIIIAAGIGGIATVNIARSYASGGTFYATGHLNAVAALRRFAVTRSEEDYNDYRRRIHVPSSDRVAREILEESDIPIQNSYPFLIEGRNDYRDAPGIAWLFRAFSNTPVFKPAVDVWRRADHEIENLDALANRLYRDTSFNSTDALHAIDEVNARLNTLEDRFARELGTAARDITTMLYAGLSGFGVALAALVIALGYRTHARLTAAQ